MRKQTKLVAVLSTAALLAIGASMTSFAAGWTEEDGTWVYLDNNSDRVTQEWRRSGENWFWLDDNGEMAVDQLIEDDDDYYYVNEAGAMVSNQWVAIENEDAGEEDEPDYYWYYFQANGKAYKRSDNADDDVLGAKTINGKKYAFDTEGRMLYGWVSGGERETGDDAWMEADYYFGDENDGAMAQGWTQISIIDENSAEDLQPGDEFWDEDQDRWFYFLTSGKKVRPSDEDIEENDQAIKTRPIDGRRYGFDQYGRMIGNWYSEASVGIASQGDADYSHSFMYFNSPEDGARVTDDWFRVVPGYYLDEEKYDDGEIYWYHSDGKGKLYTNTIETIKGKKYAFDEYGRMIDGLALIQMKTEDGRIKSSDIKKRFEADGDYNYETEDDFNESVTTLAEGITSGEYRFYYFGDAEDGSMKTGKQTVEIDGDSFTFKFKDSTSSKGAGIHGKDDDKLYMGGKLLEADSDEKYQAVLYVELDEVKDADGEVEQEEAIYMSVLDVDDFLGYFCGEAQLTDNGKVVTAENEDKADAETYFVKEGEDLYAAVEEYTDIDFLISGEDEDAEVTGAEVELYLVNTSGSMVKKKSAAKDGSDYKFEVENYKIKSVSSDL